MPTELKTMLDAMLLIQPAHALLVILLLAAASQDWRCRRIPNGLVFGGAALGLLMQAASAGAAGLLSGLEGMLAGLVLLLPFYLLRVMGAGDVKLMAMTGSFLALPLTMYAVLATLITGGLLAFAWALGKGVLRQVAWNIGLTLQGALLSVASAERPSLAIAPSQSVGRLPYGLAIAGGTIACLVLHHLS